MKHHARFALAALLVSSLAACSSSSDNDDNSSSGGSSTPVVPSTNGDANPVTPPANDPATPGTGTPGTGTPGVTPGDDPSTDPAPDPSTDPEPTSENPAVSPLGDGQPIPATPGQNIPALADPFAPAIPSPNQADPFGDLLEVDPEVSVAGIPTTPKNLRVDLISNDWAEFSWAPSNDSVGEVVAYNIYRSDQTDGSPTYVVGRDQTDPASGSQAEIDKFFATTSFIDCNYTRFFDRLHNCQVNGPQPGDTFSYQVTAVDNDGNESARSNPITITYYLEQNAPIPRYDDFYLANGDRFAQEHDLSSIDNFLPEFELVFEDEFDGTDINEAHWNTELVWEDTRIINGEQQYFVRTQNQPDFGYNPFNLTGETLIIESIPTPPALQANLPPVCSEPDPTGNDRCLFLSGALSSHDKAGFTYGYVEGRMKVGGTPGQLSSFYLYHRYPGQGRNRHAPEIDIIEYLGENPFGDEDAFQTYHFEDVTYTNDDGEFIRRSAPTMSFKNPDGELYSDDFHTYGVLWEPQLVIWYIDGQEIKRLSGPQVARQQMNLVTYLVSGSAWAPTPDLEADIYPLQYEIDYIRVYQRPAYIENGSFPPLAQ